MLRKSLPVGKKVRIRTRSSTYEGILKSADIDDAYIKTQTKTWAIPFDQIIEIKEIIPPSSLKTETEEAEVFDLSENLEEKK